MVQHKYHITVDDTEGIDVTINDGYDDDGDFFIDLKDYHGSRAGSSDDNLVDTFSLSARDLRAIVAALVWAENLRAVSKGKYPQYACDLMAVLADSPLAIEYGNDDL